MRGETIVAVGPSGEMAVEFPDLPERDLGRAVLLPGLIDAHCHLEWSVAGGLAAGAGFADWLGRMLRLGRRMTPADFAAAAMLGALRALEAGTTTVADSGPTGAAAAALRAAGLRGVVHVETFGRHEGRAATEAAAAHADRVEAIDGGPRVLVGVSPHAPYTVSPEYWHALLERDDLAARPWATHLAESQAESRLLAGGDGPLAELFAARGATPGRWPGDGSPVARLAAAGVLRAGLVAAHCVQLDPDDPHRLAERGVGVAHCPLSNARLGCGRSPLAGLRAAGARLGLGTDSPASAGEYDLRAEARACAEVHAGTATLDPADLVELVTLGGAAALGMEGRRGTLAAGMDADLVAIRPPEGIGDPYAAALHPAGRVELVMVAGEIVLDRRGPLGLDRDAVLARAGEARRRIGG